MWSWIRRIFGKASPVTAGRPSVPVVSEPASPVVLPPLAAITPPAAVIEPRYKIVVMVGQFAVAPLVPSTITVSGPLPLALIDKIIFPSVGGLRSLGFSVEAIETGEKGVLTLSAEERHPSFVFVDQAVQEIVDRLTLYWSERQVPHEVEEIRRITAAR